MSIKRRASRPHHRPTSGGLLPPVPSRIVGAVDQFCPAAPRERFFALTVYAANASARQRRNFDRLCARESIAVSILEELPAHGRSEALIPSVYRCAGHSGNMARLCAWIDSELHFSAALELRGGAPGIAAGSGSCESAGAARAIRRSTMPKAEREARYARESAEYHAAVRADDRAAMIAREMRAEAVNRGEVFAS